MLDRGGYSKTAASASSSRDQPDGIFVPRAVEMGEDSRVRIAPRAMPASKNVTAVGKS